MKKFAAARPLADPDAAALDAERTHMRAEEARGGLNGQAPQGSETPAAPPSALALDDLLRAAGFRGRCATGCGVGRDQIAELGMSVATVVHQEGDQ